MKNKFKSASELLRLKAEALIKNKQSTSALSGNLNFNQPINLSEDEILKLIRDLEVHQFELELQNEELIRANAAEQAATEKYRKLYDFAPTGYFTLSQKGEIIDVNLYGSQMLGKERSQLINNRFGLFISDEAKPIFNCFFEEIFILA